MPRTTADSTIAGVKLADDDGVRRLIELARGEDLGAGDLTSALLSNPEEAASFRLLARQRGVFAGREIAGIIAAAYDPAVTIAWTTAAVDGGRIDTPPAELALIRGPLAAVLAAERVLLNFLQRLCGVATLTRAFVDAVAGTGAAIYDTRKTMPGWRSLDKYAVRCGGGSNHRLGLFDAVLIKDNHLAGIASARLAATVFELLNRLRHPDGRRLFVEVEADSVAQVEHLLQVVSIDAVLLDNFTLEELAESVALRDGLGLRGQVALEASGGITPQTVRAVAETGVERISVGAITHSAPALDLSLERV